MKRLGLVRTAALAAVLLASAAAAAMLYLGVAQSATPSGQPPLSRLKSGDLSPLRETFNAAADRSRLLVMLSPT